MLKTNMTALIETMKSKCCGADIMVDYGEDGTNHYECIKCLKPCDPYVKPMQKSHNLRKSSKLKGKLIEKELSPSVHAMWWEPDHFTDVDKKDNVQPPSSNKTEWALGWDKEAKEFEDKTGFSVQELIDMKIVNAVLAERKRIKDWVEKNEYSEVDEYGDHGKVVGVEEFLDFLDTPNKKGGK